MSNVFDYLEWRGDILFSQVPPNSVDALIFSALSYVDYDGIVPEDVYHFSFFSGSSRNSIGDSKICEERILLCSTAPRVS